MNQTRVDIDHIAPIKSTADKRLNNFDLIRLLLASSVVFLHAYALSLNPLLKVLAKIANLSLTDTSFDRSSLAVKGFFVISGYLIFKSYDKSESVEQFFRKRFLRIYPAYAVVIVTTSLACSLLTSLPASKYFLGPFWKYLFANLAFCTSLYPRIPGVFAENPGLKLVNGALWTIKVEVMFYCAVPVLHHYMKRVYVILVAAAIYMLSIAYKAILMSTHHLQLANQLPGQLSFFVSGAVFYYNESAFLEKARWYLLPCMVIFGIEHTIGVEIFQPFALSVLILYLALRVPALLPFRPQWDLSYGIYIIHFPILQWLVSRGLLVNHPYSSLLIAGVLVATSASVSWLLVERPMLRRKLE